MVLYFLRKKNACYTVTPKMLSCVMFLSISQIEKAGTMQQKTRQKGNTNVIILSRTIDHRGKNDNSCWNITDISGRREENMIPFVFVRQKEPHERNTVSLRLQVQKQCKSWWGIQTYWSANLKQKLIARVLQVQEHRIDGRGVAVTVI